MSRPSRTGLRSAASPGRSVTGGMYDPRRPAPARPASLVPRHRGVPGGVLELVGQRSELGLSVAALQRSVDQEVCEHGVPRLARSAQVVPDRVAEADTLAAVAVVPVPGDDLAERARRRPEIGAGAVVLEAYEEFGIPLNEQVADRTPGHGLGERARRRGEVGALLDRPGVEEPGTGQLHAAGRLVEAPEQFVARTDGEQGGPIVDRLADPWALDVGQVRGDQPLVELPAVADHEEIHLAGVYPVAETQLPHVGRDAAPAAEPGDRREVAAVAVAAHDLGVQVADRDRVPGHR